MISEREESFYDDFLFDRLAEMEREGILASHLLDVTSFSQDIGMDEDRTHLILTSEELSYMVYDSDRPPEKYSKESLDTLICETIIRDENTTHISREKIPRNREGRGDMNGARVEHVILS